MSGELTFQAHQSPAEHPRIHVDLQTEQRRCQVSLVDRQQRRWDCCRIVRAVDQFDRHRLTVTVTSVVQRRVVGFLNEAELACCAFGFRTCAS